MRIGVITRMIDVHIQAIFLKLANAAISCSSRKQKSVALSSTEAEYVSLSEASKEAIHLKNFLGEILENQEEVIIFNDNQDAGQMTKNPICHGKAKHMDIRYHHIREVVDAGTINLQCGISTYRGDAGGCSNQGACFSKTQEMHGRNGSKLISCHKNLYPLFLSLFSFASLRRQIAS